MLLFLFFTLILSEDQFTPSGKYCGELYGIITITAKIKTTQRIDLSITILGKSFNCLDEVVILNTDNSISFPNSYNRQNCLYKIFDEFGRDNVSFNYNSVKDIVDVNTRLGLIHMEHCRKKRNFLLK